MVVPSNVADLASIIAVGQKAITATKDSTQQERKSPAAPVGAGGQKVSGAGACLGAGNISHDQPLMGGTSSLIIRDMTATLSAAFSATFIATFIATIIKGFPICRPIEGHMPPAGSSRTNRMPWRDGGCSRAVRPVCVRNSRWCQEASTGISPPECQQL
jgi:hypothetical protein